MLNLSQAKSLNLKPQPQQQKSVIAQAIVNTIKQAPLSYVYNIDYLQSSKATHYSQKNSISKTQQHI